VDFDIEVRVQLTIVGPSSIGSGGSGILTSRRYGRLGVNCDVGVSRARFHFALEVNLRGADC
jgi:hypothetical protein